MRIKTDYMGNDQLLPAYNIQIGVADEYIAVVDVIAGYTKRRRQSNNTKMEKP